MGRKKRGGEAGQEQGSSVSAVAASSPNDQTSPKSEAPSAATRRRFANSAVGGMLGREGGAGQNKTANDRVDAEKSFKPARATIETKEVQTAEIDCGPKRDWWLIFILWVGRITVTLLTIALIVWLTLVFICPTRPCEDCPPPGENCGEGPNAGCINGEKMSVPMDFRPLTDWIEGLDPFFIEDMQASADVGAVHRFDHLLLGIYHRDVNADLVEAHVQFSLAASHGQRHARGLRAALPLSPIQLDAAKARFALVLSDSGARGLFRLGQHYMGADVFECAKELGASLPFCRPNDFVVRPSLRDAYVNFRIAELCQLPSARQWRVEVGYKLMDGDGGVNLPALNQRANEIYDQGVGEFGSEEAYCGTNPPMPPPLPEDPVVDPSDSGNDIFVTGPVGPLPFRANPVGLPPRAGDPGAANDGPVCPPGGPSPCPARDDALELANQAQRLLRLGDAELAIGNLPAARDLYEDAIDTGRPYGAPASSEAAKRLQLLSLTCEMTEESIARISRRSPIAGGEIIPLRYRQQALKAFGYYTAEVDNEYGPSTSAAVKSFQREMGAAETGTLTPVETVVLICSAAQNQRDLTSQNLLGVMYATGHGVVHNVDLALQWLTTAEERGSADAAYNLAILYGTRTIIQSYRVCAVPENPRRADAYLQAARRRGHPAATALEARHAGKSPTERWSDIELEIVMPARLEAIGPGCNP